MAQINGPHGTQSDNQKLQATMNDRAEELKPSRAKTGAGETSTSGSQTNARGNETNVDGNVGSENRDVETFETPDRNMGARVGDDRDSRNH